MVVIGDCVIINGSKTNSSLAHRLFGVVVDVSEALVTVQTSDGWIHVREHQSVAVYVQKPRNWERLYRGVELFSEIKGSLVEHSKRPKRRSKTPRFAGEQ